VSLICCFRVEREKAGLDTSALVRVVRGSVLSGGNREGLSTDARRAGGPARSSCEVSVMETEPRGGVICGDVQTINQIMDLGGVAWAN